uniref:Photosystem II reaction center protein Ycf12 n=1 Tax=Chorda asiatica TaxID=1281577 RepID=A0A8F0FA09_9PHAE|nr:hypothetical protein V2475_pgp033 [Chorda asiatica]QWK43127.1 hypothetical protein [Chorda asiatica]WAM62246.1 hypothetical protein [Chorda asiatica]
MNWQVIGQLLTAVLILLSGPYALYLAKKADL